MNCQGYQGGILKINSITIQPGDIFRQIQTHKPDIIVILDESSLIRLCFYPVFRRYTYAYDHVDLQSLRQDRYWTKISTPIPKKRCFEYTNDNTHLDKKAIGVSKK